MRPESPEKSLVRVKNMVFLIIITDGNFSTKINASAVWRDNAVNKL